MNKQAKKDQAYKKYKAINDPAYKKYKAISDPAWKEYKAKCKKIDEQEEDIKIIDGKRYKLIKE